MLQIADRWFDRRSAGDGITHIWEPHVKPLLRCNIWHVAGRDRHLMIDTGLGVVSLMEAARDILEKPVTAFATHTHSDHTGGIFEFEDRIVHSEEARSMAEARDLFPLRASLLGEEGLAALAEAGYGVDPGDDYFIDAILYAGYDPDAYDLKPAPATQIVEEGDVISLGDRSFEVLHLPGHSPGSAGLWEKETGILFSGDAIYDGPLLDNIPGAEIDRYIATMERLVELPVRVVHGGHDPSFGRERLQEIARTYLAKWRA